MSRDCAKRKRNAVVTQPAAGSGGSGGFFVSTAGLDDWDRRIARLHFAGYRLVGKIGAGGMGRVYKAEQSSLERPVAIKVLDVTHLASDRFRTLFLKEVEVLARLRHPGVVSIIDAGDVEDVPYLVMEYVEGTTLRRLMASQDLTPAQVIVICSRICEALDAAHRLGIVHHDLKPENVMVSRQGVVKVMDFGVAVMRITADENRGENHEPKFAGTTLYSAPELAGNRSSEAATDVYSLGVMMYEMLTLSLPSSRWQPPSQINTQCPKWLDSIVAKSMAPEPPNRFATAGELLAALRHGAAEAERRAIQAEFAEKASRHSRFPRKPPPIKAVRRLRSVVSRLLGGMAFMLFGWSLFLAHAPSVTDDITWRLSPAYAARTWSPCMPGPDDNTMCEGYRAFKARFHISFMLVITAVGCFSLMSASTRSDTGRTLLQLLLSATGLLAMGYVLKMDQASSNWKWFAILQHLGPGSLQYWGGVAALLLGAIVSPRRVPVVLLLLVHAAAGSMLMADQLPLPWR